VARGRRRRSSPGQHRAVRTPFTVGGPGRPVGPATVHAVLLLVGGSSSVGKTTAARQAAAALGCNCHSVDDLHGQMDAAVSEFFAQPEFWRQTPDLLFAGLLTFTEALQPVISRLIETKCLAGERAIIEGEGIEPRFCRSLTGGESVSAVFVVELEERQIHKTLMGRVSPGGDRYRTLSPAEQSAVCTMNVAYGEWLQTQARECGYPWVPAQPWSTLAARLLGMVGG
jgi:hypothetical protein